MERRAKEAREKSLQELKRLRSTGSATRDHASSEDEEAVNPYRDILAVHSSDEEWIDHVPSSASQSERGSERSKKRIKVANAVEDEKAESAKKDEFFVNLIAQLDEQPEVESVPVVTDPIVSEIDWDEPLPDFPTIPPAIAAKNILPTMTSEVDPPSTIDTLKIESIALAPVTEESSNDSVSFYYIDAHERPNGTVYLFGLVKDGAQGYKSACLTVKNVLRNVFLLPKEFVTIDDLQVPNTMEMVKAELDEQIKRFGIKAETVSVRCVSRRYAFEVPGIPTEADWVKLTYPYSQPQFNTTNGRTFSHVFGSSTAPLEMFIVKRRIMGPCWLSIKPSSTGKRGVSWCVEEFEVENPKDVSVLSSTALATPDLTVLSLSIKSVPSLDGSKREIVAASGVIFKNVSVDAVLSSSTQPAGAFSVVREDGPNQALPSTASSIQNAYGNKGKLEVAKCERALLSYLVAIIHRWDPDVIIGHNILGVDLNLLIQRMRSCQTANWSRLGRLNWSQWPKQERQVLSGRLVCDTFLGAKEHVRSKNYLLSTLVESQLNVSDHQLSVEESSYSSLYRAQSVIDPRQLVQMIKSSESEAFLQAQLAFRLHLLSLSKQLTNIAGNLWNRTLTGARAERNEYLFLHEFHNLKFILPDKRQYNQQYQQVDLEDSDNEEQEQGSGKRKPKYSGGLVLEPKRGLYTDIVMLLDFNSLYPSLIQEFNICFTTVEREDLADEIPQLPDSSLPQGILPRIIYNLVQRRRQVKSLMKDSKLSAEDRQQLNIRQQALKLTANSMYGCLGFAHSRFHARPLAALITAKGREVLQSTVDLARMHLGLDVIYGDTDSVMISTGLMVPEEARLLAAKLKKAVNERYKCLEIELDGLFKRLLLLRKKKYAAIKWNEEEKEVLETKGLDMVRRDWCRLSVDSSNYCLQQIMKSSVEMLPDLAGIIGKYLRDLHSNLLQQPIESFVISKNLTKDPQLYADYKGQPHVAVALRMRERGITVHAGDTIQYVICSRPSSSMAERAFSVDEVKRDPSLSIGTNY